jgi:gluconolactonase
MPVKYGCLLLLIVTGCTIMKDSKTIGSIERLDPSVNSIVKENAKIEVLGEGYEWSEGPVWVASENMLLFSDVPTNKIYKWTEEKGVELYLTPSGYTGSEPSKSKEPGSNGLTLDTNGKLILCQHGDRRVARLDSDYRNPKPNFVTLADRFQGKRFNSPNDVVVRKNGDVFFTDPPYGLPNQENDSTKEITFHGVYKISRDGSVTLLVDSLTRPNGLAFTPDEKTLIVANSDPEKAVWYAFDLDENDSIRNQRIFYDVTNNFKIEGMGLPDGLRIDKEGNIFATGPGGVWIFNKDGKVIGKIKLPQPTANCALADDGKTLFLTSDMYLLRIRLRE